MNLNANQRRCAVTLVLLLLLLMLAACGFGRDESTPTPAQTPDVSPTPTTQPTEPAPASPTPDPDDDSQPLPNVSDLRWEMVADAPGDMRQLTGITTDVVGATPSPNGRWWTLELVEEYLMGGPARTVLYAIDTEGDQHWSVTHEDRSDWQQAVWLSDNRLLYINRGELEQRSFDEILQVDAPERLYELWLGGDETVLASGHSALWRLDLATMEWDRVEGMDDALVEDEPPISRAPANLTIAPVGSFAAVIIAGELWRVPLTVGESAQQMGAIEYLGRGGRILAPEPLRDSPYWSIGEPVAGAEGVMLALLDTRDGTIVPMADVLADAGVDLAPVGRLEVSPDGRWVAVGLADAGSALGAPARAFYLAAANDLTAGRVVSGTQLLDWRLEPAATILHDENTGAVQSVPLLEGEPVTFDATFGPEARIGAESTDGLTIVAENADLYAFDEDGTQQATFRAPANVGRFYGSPGDGQVAFGTTSGEMGAPTTGFWLWDVLASGEEPGAGDWTTFRSEALGISIEHPATWSVREPTADDPTAYLTSDEQFGEGPEPIEYYVYITEYDNPDGATFEQVVAEQAGIDPAQLAYSRDSIGPYTVYRTTSIPSRAGALTVFFTEDGSRYVSVALTPYDADNPFEEQARFVETFERMLQSVELLGTRAVPTATSTPAPRATPTATPAVGGFTQVELYMIAIGDEGQHGAPIGCNDSVVPVTVNVEQTRAPLTAALQHLLSLNERLYGETDDGVELTNHLSESNLTIDDIDIENGTAVIRLAGTLQMGGVCDGPRVEAQLEQTVLQFATVRDVQIFIDGRPLEDILDLRGDVPAPTPTPTETSDGDGFTQVNLFLVAEGDNGQSGRRIGCDDSIVPVQVDIEPTAAPLTAAIERLLALEERAYGQSGLTNALYRSDLSVERITIADGTATIRLRGTIQLDGTCDAPRVEAQLEETALQFSTVDAVEIVVNGEPLEDVLSQRG